MTFCDPGGARALALDAGSARLWLVDLAAGEGALLAFGTDLNLVPAEAADIARDTAISTRRRSANIALRAILAGSVGLEAARRPFQRGLAGKPRLEAAAASGIEFSLSHCETIALIGVSRRGPIGVDIEAARSVRIGAGRRAQLEALAQALAPGAPLPAEPDDRRFLQAWVRMEALAKATGEGIAAFLGRAGARQNPDAATVGLAEPGTLLGDFVVRDLEAGLPPATQAAVAYGGDREGGEETLPLTHLPVDPQALGALVARLG